MGTEKGKRAKLMRALHAEGKKKGLDHDALRDAMGVKSLADAPEEQLVRTLKLWTKKPFRRSDLPRRGYVATGDLEMVSAEDLDLVRRAFDVRELTPEARLSFVKRQLRGRGEIRTKADFYKVFSGIRAMNRRPAA